MFPFSSFKVAHVNEIPCRSSSPSAAVSPKPLCDYYLLASVMSSSCFSPSSQTSAADSASRLLCKRVLFSTLFHGGGLCDPKYSPSSPFCMQLVDSAASDSWSRSTPFTPHPVFSAVFKGWFLVLCAGTSLGIEFKTLSHNFTVGSSLEDWLLQHLRASGQNSSHTCKIVFAVSGNQRILL